MDSSTAYPEPVSKGSLISGRWNVLYVGTAVLSSVGLIGKLPLLHQVLPLPVSILGLLLACGLLLPFAARFAVRFRLFLAPICCLIVLGGIFVAFPRTERLHSIGKGSDQPDCVIVGSRELVSGRWPYRLDRMWSHHPMSCGPGWITLQAPVTRELGYPVNMGLIWLGSFVVLYLALGWNKAATVLVLLCFSPGTWLAIANGTDFLTFGLTSAAVFAAGRRWGSGVATKIVIALFAGLVDQFRITTLFLPALLTSAIGPAFACASFVLAVAFELCFLFWNPQAFLSDGPMHVLEKLVRLMGASVVGPSAQSPWLLSGFLVVPSAFVFLILLLILRRWPWERVAAICFAMLFFLPALLDLRQKWLVGSGLLNALQSWEGGMWMMACLPLFALFSVELVTRPANTE